LVSLPSSTGFPVSDPGRAPFGAAWLRGITPMRLVAVAAVCTMTALSVSIFNFARDDFSTVCANWLLRAMDSFLAAIPMLILVVNTDLLTTRSKPRARVAALVAAVVIGAASYAAIRWGLGARSFYPHLANPGLLWYNAVANVFRGLAIGGLLTAILYFAARERDSARELHQARLSEIEVERQIAEARLKLLQAQIEPHFLFNSLASVKRLYEREPGRGRDLLEGLRDYLRAATGSARQRETRLGDEIALARSFLAIFQVRMGNRLQVRIGVPVETESAQIPPLMVGTLIENAIKHGIGPRSTGGTLSLAARRQGDALVVEVGDDGVGFRHRSGHGVGLANIRARLQTLFGSAGTLDLAANPDGGVTATIRLPFRLAEERRSP
jgi:signal transduction histidine kinase